MLVFSIIFIPLLGALLIAFTPSIYLMNSIYHVDLIILIFLYFSCSRGAGLVYPIKPIAGNWINNVRELRLAIFILLFFFLIVIKYNFSIYEVSYGLNTSYLAHSKLLVYSSNSIDKLILYTGLLNLITILSQHFYNVSRKRHIFLFYNFFTSIKNFIFNLIANITNCLKHIIYCTYFITIYIFSSVIDFIVKYSCRILYFIFIYVRNNVISLYISTKHDLTSLLYSIMYYIYIINLYLVYPYHIMLSCISYICRVIKDLPNNIIIYIRYIFSSVINTIAYVKHIITHGPVKIWNIISRYEPKIKKEIYTTIIPNLYLVFIVITLVYALISSLSSLDTFNISVYSYIFNLPNAKIEYYLSSGGLTTLCQQALDIYLRSWIPYLRFNNIWLYLVLGIEVLFIGVIVYIYASMSVNKRKAIIINSILFIIITILLYTVISIITPEEISISYWTRYSSNTPYLGIIIVSLSYCIKHIFLICVQCNTYVINLTISSVKNSIRLRKEKAKLMKISVRNSKLWQEYYNDTILYYLIETNKFKVTHIIFMIIIYQIMCIFHPYIFIFLGAISVIFKDLCARVIKPIIEIYSKYILNMINHHIISSITSLKRYTKINAFISENNRICQSYRDWNTYMWGSQMPNNPYTVTSGGGSGGVPAPQGPQGPQIPLGPHGYVIPHESEDESLSQNYLSQGVYEQGESSTSRRGVLPSELINPYRPDYNTAHSTFNRYRVDPNTPLSLPEEYKTFLKSRGTSVEGKNITLPNEQTISRPRDLENLLSYIYSPVRNVFGVDFDINKFIKGELYYTIEELKSTLIISNRIFLTLRAGINPLSTTWNNLGDSNSSNIKAFIVYDYSNQPVPTNIIGINWDPKLKVYLTDSIEFFNGVRLKLDRVNGCVEFTYPDILPKNKVFVAKLGTPRYDTLYTIGKGYIGSTRNTDINTFIARYKDFIKQNDGTIGIIKEWDSLPEISPCGRDEFIPLYNWTKNCIYANKPSKIETQWRFVLPNFNNNSLLSTEVFNLNYNKFFGGKNFCTADIIENLNYSIKSLTELFIQIVHYKIRYLDKNLGLNGGIFCEYDLEKLGYSSLEIYYQKLKTYYVLGHEYMHNYYCTNSSESRSRDCKALSPLNHISSEKVFFLVVLYNIQAQLYGEPLWLNNVTTSNLLKAKNISIFCTNEIRKANFHFYKEYLAIKAWHT